MSKLQELHLQKYQTTLSILQSYLSQSNNILKVRTKNDIVKITLLQIIGEEFHI